MKSKTTFTKAAFVSGKNGVPPDCLKRVQVRRFNQRVFAGNPDPN